MKPFPALLLTLLLAGCVSEKPGVPDYAVHLVQKATVGAKYRLTATGSVERRMSASVDGQARPPQASQAGAEVAARGEVLAVTRRGEIRRTRLVIERALVMAGGRPAEFLPGGAVVTAQRNGDKTEFLVGGLPASPPVAEALETAGILMAGDDGASDDDIFGTRERKKVGDTWSVNAVAAAADLARKGMPVAPGALAGTVTLAGLANVGGQDLLRITAEFAVRGAGPPPPPGFTVQSSEFTASLAGLFPLDQAKGRLAEKMALHAQVVYASTAAGQPEVRAMELRATRELTYTYLQE